MAFMQLPDEVRIEVLERAGKSSRLINRELKSLVDGARRSLTLQCIPRFTPKSRLALYHMLGAFTNLQDLQFDDERPWLDVSHPFNVSPPLDCLYACSSLTNLNVLNAEVHCSDDLTLVSHLTGLRTLAFKLQKSSDLTQLPAFCQHLTKLQLNVFGMWTARAILPLAQCTALIYLDLTGFESLVDMQALEACPLLTLRIIRCRRAVSLPACCDLRELDLEACPALTDVSALAFSPLLSSLRIIDCNHLMDLSPVAACTRITSISISPWQHAEGLVALEHLSSLTQIYVRKSPLILALWTTSIAGMCASLRSVDLRGCFNLKSVRPLAACTRLTELNLQNCPVDVDMLATCTALERLIIGSEFRSTHVSVSLRALVTLTSLTMCNVRPADLLDIHTLTRLTFLSLGMAPYTPMDLDVLGDIPLCHLELLECTQLIWSPLTRGLRGALTKLHCSDKLTNISALPHLPALRNLHLPEWHIMTYEDMFPLLQCRALQVLSPSLNLNVIQLQLLSNGVSI